MRQNVGLWLVAGGVVAGCGLLWMMATMGDGKTKSKVSTPKGLDARDLYADYEDNEVVARRIHQNGKPILVFGHVRKVKGNDSESVVILVAGKHTGDDVECRFSGKEVDKTARLYSGDLVSIRGTVTGFSVRSVHMDQCQIVGR